MKKTFPGYNKEDKEYYKDLFANGLIILDTNLLTDLYRYKAQSRLEFISTLKQVQNRLWIPYHVALEYNRNRMEVIREQQTTYSKVKRIIQSNLDNIRENLDKLNLKKRHSQLEEEGFLKSINTLEKKLISEIDNEQKTHTIKFDSDDIYESLSNLFESKIGNRPENQTVIDEINDAGKKRFKNLIPPGYKDFDKGEDTFTYSDITYFNKYGDLYIWKEIIQHVKNEKIQSVIFVTNDDKEDWWLKEGRKTLGPRPELIEEVLREAKLKQFHIYNSVTFLTHLDKHLGQVINRELIDHIAKVKNSILTINPVTDSTQITAYSIFTKWANEYMPMAISIEGDGLKTIVVTTKPDNDKEFFYIKAIIDIHEVIEEVLREIMRMGEKHIDDPTSNEHTLVLVFQNYTAMIKAEKLYHDALKSKLQDNIRVILGSVIINHDSLTTHFYQFINIGNHQTISGG